MYEITERERRSSARVLSEMRALFMLLIYAILGSLGLTFMKKTFNASQAITESIKSPVLIAGFGLYGFSFILWLKILQQYELSYAFPIASAALFTFISLFSWLLLDEQLNSMKIMGMVIIIIGIIVASRG
jgi:drug/metabolite transporter (DMT)-like permease